MKIFLSWSGGRSKEVAGLLSDWLCCVIQASRPWISSRDIDRGSIWFNEIHDQLKDTSVGIICLTQENKNRPWILFEAGALAKGLSTSRVCTLLIDLEPKDIEDPLAQFNHTLPNKENLLSLVKTLNGSMAQNSLDIRILELVFETYWPQFQERFEAILKTTENTPPPKPRPKDDVLYEILENTRSVATRVNRLEMENKRLRRSNANMPQSLHPRFESNREIEKFIRTLVKEGASKDMIGQLVSNDIPPWEFDDIMAKISLPIKDN